MTSVPANDVPVERSFALSTAGASSMVIAIAGVVVVETTALHFLLARSHPVLAWAFTISSATLLLWLAADYRALSWATVRVDETAVHLDVGIRFRLTIPRARIAAATRTTWRDLPKPGSAFLNATKPAQPNIVLTMREPWSIRLMGMVDRPIRQLGLHVDDPAGLMDALGAL